MVLTVASNFGGEVTISKLSIDKTDLTVSTDYTVTDKSGNKEIKIKKARLKIKASTAKDYEIIITADKGIATVPLTVYESEVTAEPSEIIHTHEEEKSSDIIISYDGEGDFEIEAVKVNNSALTETSEYTKEGNTITLLGTYLAGLAKDEYTITIETTRGDATVMLTVNGDD